MLTILVPELDLYFPVVGDFSRLGDCIDAVGEVIEEGSRGLDSAREVVWEVRGWGSEDFFSRGLDCAREVVWEVRGWGSGDFGVDSA